MNVHEGDYALGLKPDTEHKQPFLKQYITGLTEKATYTLTEYIKKDSLTGTPATKILFYDNNGTSYTDKGSEGYEFHTAENGQWTQITNTFTVPDGADTAEVYLRVLESASGAVYWDDLTVEMVL